MQFGSEEQVSLITGVDVVEAVDLIYARDSALVDHSFKDESCCTIILPTTRHLSTKVMSSTKTLSLRLLVQ